MATWDIDKARRTYNLPHWGNGYFDINERGHVLVRPNPEKPASSFDLYELATSLSDAGLSLPVLVRFSGILHHRVDTLCNAFTTAFEMENYQGHYTAVYPIKVNQQKSVVHALLDYGGNRIGLEAGSKPELLAVLAHAPAGGIVVCNGYKDREYIRLALIGQAMKHRVYLVVEKLSELDLLIQEAKAMGIAPRIGVRVRLASLGSGRWQNSGGEKSKFGLSSAEVLRVVERLRQEEMLSTLEMLHFHMGSQIANIQDIQGGMREAARYFSELHALGAGVKCINVGGGLGIDYEGSRSRNDCSINYSIQEYANNVVHTLWEVCDALGLPHPDIISESGRALTAHHAAIIANIIDTETGVGGAKPKAAINDEPQIIHDLWYGFNTMSERSAVEAYHDAAYRLSEAHTMYNHGVLTLGQRARVEQLYTAICWKVRSQLNPSSSAHRALLDELNERLADKYFVNFSLFQSIPDHWAFKQIFPVVPLHRLDERPTRRGILQDITCDSDGRLFYYVDTQSIETSLPLHTIKKNDTYLIGIFLVGAYQEILGDMHNLFGDTDSVHVEIDDNGKVRLEQLSRGDTVNDVLRYVHFEPSELIASYRTKIDAVEELSSQQRQAFFDELTDGMNGYTYLED